MQGQGIVDGSGNCEIDFLAPPTGLIYTGSITVYDSPVTALWQVLVSGVPTDKISGTQTCGGIQVGTNDIITLTAGGLQQFIGQTFHATYAVVASPEDNTVLIAPGHDTLIPPGQLANAQLILDQENITVTNPGKSFTLNLPACAALLVVIEPISGAQDLGFDIRDPVTNFVFGVIAWKVAGEVGASIFEIAAFRSTLQLDLDVTAASTTVTIRVYALQALTLPSGGTVVPPNLIPFANTGQTANTINTSPTFALNGWEGTLSLQGSTGLGTAPLTGQALGLLQVYTGSGGPWLTVGAVGVSASVPADSATIITPPGSGRLLSINQASVAQNLTLSWSQ